MSAMRETMAGQPAALRELLADGAPVETAAEALAGRRVWLVGTGTSWHAANHGAWLLREAGRRGVAAAGRRRAAYGPAPPAAGDGLVLLSHTGAKRHANTVLERARAAGVRAACGSARAGTGADIETVERETLLRLHREPSRRRSCAWPSSPAPSAPTSATSRRCPTPSPRRWTDRARACAPPARLLELTGAGPNQWTAAEGALKVREAARVAAEGLAVEQLLHGPAVALGADDALVCLDGGGPLAERLDEIATLARGRPARRVHRVTARELGEPLSVFALTVAVQRIALDCRGGAGHRPGRVRLRRAGARGGVGGRRALAGPLRPTDRRGP